MKDDGEVKGKSGVVDISHVYVGPNQRQTLLDQAFATFRKKGYSYNQAKALAAQAVDAFMDEQRKKRLADIQNANHEDADRLAQEFIDDELGPRGGSRG